MCCCFGLGADTSANFLPKEDMADAALRTIGSDDAEEGSHSWLVLFGGHYLMSTSLRHSTFMLQGIAHVLLVLFCLFMWTILERLNRLEKANQATYNQLCLLESKKIDELYERINTVLDAVYTLEDA